MLTKETILYSEQHISKPNLLKYFPNVLNSIVFKCVLFNVHSATVSYTPFTFLFHCSTQFLFLSPYCTHFTCSTPFFNFNVLPPLNHYFHVVVFVQVPFCNTTGLFPRFCLFLFAQLQADNNGKHFKSLIYFRDFFLM